MQMYVGDTSILYIHMLTIFLGTIVLIRFFPAKPSTPIYMLINVLVLIRDAMGAVTHILFFVCWGYAHSLEAHHCFGDNCLH